jgi:hypothetical protein
MQIILELINPKPITITFVYNRKTSQVDALDDSFCLLAKTLSASISAESFDIKRVPNVGVENFSSVGYNSKKKINLIFRCFNNMDLGNEVEKEKAFPLILYFDTADEEYIGKIIEPTYYLKITKENCSLLDTLITDIN